MLPTTPLSTTYALCWALLSLFSGSTLILSSVSGSKVNLVAATRSARELLKPTHIITDARTVPSFLDDLTAMAGSGGLSATYSAWSTARAINQGYMPNKARPPYLPSSLSALKTLYVVQPDTLPADHRISSSTLSKLRLLLGARVALALASGRVAGYVAQTDVLDYRDKGGVNCVGSVAASLELLLVGEENEMTKADGVGDLAVRGASAVREKGKEKEKTVLEGVKARIDVDNTVVLTGSVTLI